MIGRGQVEAQHPEDRPQKALRLTKGQVKDQAERQRGFDGNLGVLQLPSALADAHGLPRGDRFRRQPQGDVASLDQCSVVRRPVSDAVFRFVPGMHSRLHVEIMPLRPSRWPGPRRTLVTAHQRLALHDQHLARLTTATSPTLCEGFGVGAHTAAELLIIFGDNPDRIRSEAAFAKLCGACPIPASSGMTTGRHRLNRGGHRHANAALYRAVIVRMQFHQPTRDYVARRIAAGRTKRDIIRCLKRFLAREIYQRVMTDFRARQEIIQAA